MEKGASCCGGDTALPCRCMDNRIRKLNLLKLSKKKKIKKEILQVFMWFVKLTTNLTLNIRRWRWLVGYSAQNLEDVEDFEEMLTASKKNT